MNPKKHPWTPANDRLLRERPTARMEIRLEVTPMAVRPRRHGLGIVRLRATEMVRRKPWQPAEEALLGTTWDAEVARRLGRSVFQVKSRRKLLKRELRTGAKTMATRWQVKHGPDAGGEDLVIPTGLPVSKDSS